MNIKDTANNLRNFIGAQDKIVIDMVRVTAFEEKKDYGIIEAFFVTSRDYEKYKDKIRPEVLKGYNVYDMKMLWFKGHPVVSIDEHPIALNNKIAR